MLVAISGASGLVGRSLSLRLRALGHVVAPLRRQGPDIPGSLRWDPQTGCVDFTHHAPATLDAIIHLAGENIGEGRWTNERKLEFHRSRVDATTALARFLVQQQAAPPHFIAASAIGYYGDRGDETLDENSAAGGDFLAGLTAAWESASKPLESAGCRVVRARFGVILSPEGGALAKMIPAFRLGLGGKLGTGRQWMSWVSLEDAVSSLIHLLTNPAISGAVNVCGPNPVRNGDFTRELGRALCRPAFFTIPATILRVVFGEKAGPLLLASQRVQPVRLTESGFVFSDPWLGPALSRMVARR